MKKALIFIAFLLIPIWVANVAQPAANEKVERGWLGVSIQDITEDIAKDLNRGDKKGALVADVFKGDPADKAGLKVGDIIVAIDNNDIKDTHDMLTRISNKKPGEEVAFIIIRDGNKYTKTAVLRSRMAKDSMVNQQKSSDIQKRKSSSSRSSEIQEAGISVSNANNAVTITEVLKGSAAEEIGLQANDVILQVGKESVKDVDHLANIIHAKGPGNKVLLLIERNKSKFFIVMTIELQQNPSAKDKKTKVTYGALKSDVDELPSAIVKPNKNAYAIVIGIENYRQKLPKADFAADDAKLMSDYLTRAMGYPEENVVMLVNDHAALGDFVKYFEKWLPNNVEKGGTVLVYYSGHGAPNPKTGDAYLVPYDGDPSFIAETGYSLKRMYDALGRLPAKEIVVALDSCFSGAGGRSVIAKGMRPLVMNIQGSLSLSRNITVLSASSGDQISATYDEKGHGLFTYFLLKGIKNEDVVKPDGSIKIDDLFRYIKPRVERIARKQYNNEQMPQLIAPKE